MNFFKKVFFGAKKEQQKEQSSQPIPSKPARQDQVPYNLLVQFFQTSAKCIGESSKQMSDQQKLIIYGLYKQATIGDCNTEKPSILDFVGKSKWNAWNNNKGMSKSQAMQIYISTVVQIDPQIQKKIQFVIEEGIQIPEQQSSSHNNKNSSSLTSGTGLKMVQQKDYSEDYSNPYFKLIQNDLDIQEVSHKLLLEKNNNPKCYPLHFAIDKERVDLVKKFLQILSVEQIREMKDQDGTGIEEYAQLIENQDIIELVRVKLHHS